MAKDQTDKSRYQSRYSSSFVTAAQYITELICEKHAKYNKKDLMHEFWKLPEWAKHFRQQIPTASKLLTKYSASAIIQALQSKAAWNIYSLRAPHLIPLIEQEEVIVKAKIESLANAAPIERADVNEKPIEKKGKPSLKDKLMELE